MRRPRRTRSRFRTSMTLVLDLLLTNFTSRGLGGGGAPSSPIGLTCPTRCETAISSRDSGGCSFIRLLTGSSTLSSVDPGVVSDRPKTLKIDSRLPCCSRSSTVTWRRLTLPWFVVYSAPSHYLNQGWLIVNWTFRSPLKRNVNHNIRWRKLVVVLFFSSKCRSFCSDLSASLSSTTMKNIAVANFMIPLQLLCHLITLNFLSHVTHFGGTFQLSKSLETCFFTVVSNKYCLKRLIQIESSQ